MADSKAVRFLRLCVSVQVLVALMVVNLVKIIFSPFWRMVFSPRQPLVVRTPDSRFNGLEKLGYTFQPNFAELPIGGGVTLPRLHYVDEGPRDASYTILCLHGEPSWSFLYRNMIPNLVSAGHRVVAPDMIGFGKSDKYSSPENYTHEMHAASVRMLIDNLNLDNIVLVCQDWGGLTGLSVLKDMPEKFHSIVVMNTGLPTGDPFRDDMGSAATPKSPLKVLEKGIPFLLWRMFATVIGTCLPVDVLFQYLVGFSAEIAAAYNAPFPDSNYKAGAAKWPLLVPLFRDDPVAVQMSNARNFLKTWTKPALVMFSDRDPITKGLDKMFMNLIPNAKQITIRGAGHFLQETHGPQIAQNVVEFIKKKK